MPAQCTIEERCWRSGSAIRPVRARARHAGEDEYPSDDLHVDELEIEDDDDVHKDTAALFDIDVGDSIIPNNVIDVNAGDGG